jgi:putative transposase
VAAGVFEAFKESLKGLEARHFTGRRLLCLFRDFAGGYGYSPAYFCRLLRRRLRMYYYKPEPRDYRQPEDARGKLAERIRGTVDGLAAMGKDISRMAIGFSDESAVQLHSNNARFWALEPRLPRPVNGSGGSAKFFGFYAIKGESVLAGMGACKGEDFKPLLLRVKEANPGSKGIILFWDNAAAHKKVETWAWEQGIYIIPLPPYSPDLNPIERVWKSCKRWVNEQGLCKKMEELRDLFVQAFETHKTQKSFAEGWCKKMPSIVP